MKAIVYRTYGPPEVLRCEDVDKPAVTDGGVLIRVRAAAVNPFDRHCMRGTPYPVRIMTGLRRPRRGRLGVDVSGEIEAVGRGVTQFAPGDEVFGACRGAFAEYACAPQTAVTRKPGSVTFEQAASVGMAGLTALQGLRDTGRLQPGQTVLINGAAGGIGTLAVQIARSFGAAVTGVCSRGSVDLVRSIGADRVIDYTRENFTSSGQRYDLILDCAATQPLSAIRRALNSTGRYVIVGGPDTAAIIWRMLGGLVLSRVSGQAFAGVRAKGSQADLTVLGDLMATGKVSPVIDRRYELSEVPEALRYMEQGHARGKIVITVGSTIVG